MAAKGFGNRPDLESPLQQAQQALIQGNWEQAETQLQALVTTRRLDPVEQGIAHDLQGQLAMVRGDLAGALVQFQQAIICQPQSALFHAHLGILLRRRGERERALSILERAIKLDPKEVEAQAALGDLRQAQGILDQAIGHYLAALERGAGDPDLPYQLGLCFWKLERTEEAIPWFEQVLELQPDHGDARYMLSVLRVLPAPTKTPPDWVSRLFDDYAPVFEAHSVRTLGYRGHERLVQAVTAVAGPNRTFSNGLDLGCGTGLVGSLFRGRVKSLVGVDLSARMIQQAHDKGIYDHLFQMDLLEFLQRTEQSFDLILAGDVFIYIGDLSQSFAACAQSLTPGGILAITTEQGLPEQDYTLGSKTGRYAHSPSYLCQLGASHGLQESCSELFTLRLEASQPVQGCVWCWQKPAD
ncbi:MAG: tetratricopeptide repeat protein [Cyanophyceae cyanobacterium]